ncbi:hypothetical protein CHUV2995_00870 [Corynebacterium diphtheriae subsp. lausannense]|nr:hypothetical protein CHUV2995_00870 [Corynebacterium diphtheriae subsp. lausannense]
MCEFPLVAGGAALFGYGCFLVQEVLVDHPELVQSDGPLACLVQGGDLGQFQR